MTWRRSVAVFVAIRTGSRAKHPADRGSVAKTIAGGPTAVTAR